MKRLRSRLNYSFYSSKYITIRVEPSRSPFFGKKPYEILKGVSSWASKRTSFSEYDLEYGYASDSQDPKDRLIASEDKTVCRLGVGYRKENVEKRVKFLWAVVNTLLKNYPELHFEIETDQNFFNRRKLEAELYQE